MEHRHRCIYCDADWFCYEGCALAGVSVCDQCREKLRESPEVPLRVIPLRESRDGWVIERLAEYDAERIRQELTRRRRPR